MKREPNFQQWICWICTIGSQNIVPQSEKTKKKKFLGIVEGVCVPNFKSVLIFVWSGGRVQTNQHIQGEWKMAFFLSNLNMKSKIKIFQKWSNEESWKNWSAQDLEHHPV